MIGVRSSSRSKLRSAEAKRNALEILGDLSVERYVIQSQGYYSEATSNGAFDFALHRVRIDSIPGIHKEYEFASIDAEHYSRIIVSARRDIARRNPATNAGGLQRSDNLPDRIQITGIMTDEDRR